MSLPATPRPRPPAARESTPRARSGRAATGRARHQPAPQPLSQVSAQLPRPGAPAPGRLPDALRPRDHRHPRPRSCSARERIQRREYLLSPRQERRPGREPRPGPRPQPCHQPPRETYHCHRGRYQDHATRLKRLATVVTVRWQGRQKGSSTSLGDLGRQERKRSRKEGHGRRPRPSAPERLGYMKTPPPRGRCGSGEPRLRAARPPLRPVAWLEAERPLPVMPQSPVPVGSCPAV